VVDGLDSAASAANSYYAATPRTALYTGQYNVAISDNTQIYLVSGSEQDDTIIGSGVRGHFVNTAGGDDLIISGGSTMAATGGDGNDVYQSGGGGGSFTGSAGTDVIVFSGNKADYTNYFTNNMRIIRRNDGSEQNTQIIGVEYVKYADKITDTLGNEITDATELATVNAIITEAGALNGASSMTTSYSTSSSSSSSSSSSGSSLSDVDLSTQSGAAAAISTLDNVLKTLSSQLAIMGAVRNRLEVSINNMTTAAI
jgi:flagellin-like hook-associated protein FlgL